MIDDGDVNDSDADNGVARMTFSAEAEKVVKVTCNEK